MSNRNGVVYTKEWVVNLILDLIGFVPSKPLWQMRAVEPSCGEGSFLKGMVDRIIESAQKAGAFKPELLRECVLSYDLDPLSVAASRSIVSDALIEAGMDSESALSLATQWVRCEDYLLAADCKIDFVIGNPPYLRSTDIPPHKRTEYCKRYDTMTMGCDVYVAFIERGLSSLNENGRLCFICADRWLQNQYGKLLRGYVSDRHHIAAIIKMHDVDAFESQVSAYPAIVLLDNGSGDIKYVACNGSFSHGDVDGLLDWFSQGSDGYITPSFEAGFLPTPRGSSLVPLTSPSKARVVQTLADTLPSLENTGVSIGIGLATGRDSVFVTDKEDLVEPERMLPVFNMRDWRRGQKNKQRWLVNPWLEDGTLIELSDYPKTKDYFESNRVTLESRHVAKKNESAWYRTIDKPNWALLGKPMLLFPDMAARAEPVYSDGSKYPCHNCYWLISDTWDLKVLGGLLMSEIAESFVDALGVKMRGGTLRFQAQYLRLIHVPPFAWISQPIRDELRSAFEEGDRDAATRAAKKAYSM